MGARYLGLDGGGSSTRALVIDGGGAIQNEWAAGASNMVVVGKERASDEVSILLGQCGRVHVIVAGIAGADRPWVRQAWQELLTPYADQVWVVGDYRIAWAALTDGNPGLAAVFGTGSVFYAEGSKGSVRLGGYGWKVGDVGSGIALGRDAVEAALADLEGWGVATKLTGAVGDWASAADPAGILNFAYDPAVDWRQVSDLAGAVFAAAAAGDRVAERILTRHQNTITQYMSTAREKAGLPQETLCGLAGGLAPLWLPRIQESMGCHLQVIERRPVEGAARLARRWHQGEGGGD